MTRMRRIFTDNNNGLSAFIGRCPTVQTLPVSEPLSREVLHCMQKSSQSHPRQPDCENEQSRSDQTEALSAG